jgi:DNA-binding XRE family transcriptional regulator
VTTGLQQTIERQRTEYERLGKPLLQYLVELHGLSVRKFAEVFSISKGHSEDLIKQRVLPSLELAVRIARYFETNVDDLFAWRVDDTGDRRPLLVEIPGTDGVIRLKRENAGIGSVEFSGLKLVERVLEAVKQGKVKTLAAKMKGGKQ